MSGTRRGPDVRFISARFLPSQQRPMSESQPDETIDEVHETVSSVYHDLNNPLSIISGNAQFLLEIGREEELDDQFVSSAQDIKQAAQRMADSLHQLTRLKEELEEEL